MNPTDKNRFSLVENDQPDEQPHRPRILMAEEDVRPSTAKSIRPIIIASSALLVAVAAIVLLTSYYKKPKIFTPSGKNEANETLYTDLDKKELPEFTTENIHLKRGRESYHRGYYNDALAELTEVVESDASDGDKAMALTYMGIIYDDKGEYNKAVDCYTRALTYDKKNPIIYRNLSLAYRHKKEYDKAGTFAEKAIDIDSKNTQNRLLLGNLYFEQGRYDDAIRAYEDTLKLDRENGSALYNLGIALYKKGDEVSAIDYLKRAGAADKIGQAAHLANSKLGVIFTRRREFDLAEQHLRLATSIAPNDPVDRYNLGIVYLKQNKPDLALEQFTRAEELGREDAAITENIGEAYYSLKDYDRSLNAYNRLLDTNRRNAKILSRLAEIYYEKGELDKAYDFYQKITAYEPASENARVAYLNMGNILDDAQRFDEAIDVYKRALAISPKDDSALFNLGIAYKHAHKPELAIESWKKASELNPDNPKPLLALADFYYENSHYDLAMDEYQRILRRWPGVQEGHFNLASIYYKKNLNDYAIASYKRVIEINDKNDLARKAYINLGMLTSRADRPGDDAAQESMSYVQKALLIQPGDPESLFSLGIIYSKREMYDRAIDTFYQALRASNDPKINADAYNNIGKCYFKKGQFKKALQSFTRGIEEDPTSEEIRMNRKVAMQAYEEELSRR